MKLFLEVLKWVILILSAILLGWGMKKLVDWWEAREIRANVDRVMNSPEHWAKLMEYVHRR